LMPSSPPVTMATGSDVSTTAFCCQDVLHSWWVARRVRSIPYNENGPFRRFRVNSHWHYKKILKLTFLEINKTNARPIAGAWHFVKETGGEILIGHFKPNDLHGLGSQAFPPPISDAEEALDKACWMDVSSQGQWGRLTNLYGFWVDTCVTNGSSWSFVCSQ